MHKLILDRLPDELVDEVRSSFNDLPHTDIKTVSLDSGDIR